MGKYIIMVVRQVEGMCVCRVRVCKRATYSGTKEAALVLGSAGGGGLWSSDRRSQCLHDFCTLPVCNLECSWPQGILYRRLINCSVHFAQQTIDS